MINLTSLASQLNDISDQVLLYESVFLKLLIILTFTLNDTLDVVVLFGSRPTCTVKYIDIRLPVIPRCINNI